MACVTSSLKELGRRPVHEQSKERQLQHSNEEDPNSLPSILGIAKAEFESRFDEAERLVAFETWYNQAPEDYVPTNSDIQFLLRHSKKFTCHYFDTCTAVGEFVERQEHAREQTKEPGDIKDVFQAYTGHQSSPAERTSSQDSRISITSPPKSLKGTPESSRSAPHPTPTVAFTKSSSEHLAPDFQLDDGSITGRSVPKETDQDTSVEDLEKANGPSKMEADRSIRGRLKAFFKGLQSDGKGKL